MHANIGSLSAKASPATTPPSRLISIPFLLLRLSTAAGAFATGFVQTLVFARVLPPERFSLFIVVGAVGYSLWLCDLGLAKILFVQLRNAHLAGRNDERVAGQATAVILFYVLIAIAAAFVCAMAMYMRPNQSMLERRGFRTVLSLHRTEPGVGLLAQHQHRG